MVNINCLNIYAISLDTLQPVKVYTLHALLPICFIIYYLNKGGSILFVPYKGIFHVYCSQSTPVLAVELSP